MNNNITTHKTKQTAKNKHTKNASNAKYNYC